MPVAETLRGLGTERAWVMHGSDGLDEMTTTGPTEVVSLENGALTRFTVTPEDAGLPRANPADLKGGDAGRERRGAARRRGRGEGPPIATSPC
jgi:anthranilate phosphoribosyltransferase